MIKFLNNIKKNTGAKKSYILLILVLFVSFLVFVLWPKSVPQEHSVVLTTSGFEPSDLTVKKGDTVKFKTELNSPFWPASDPHPLHTTYSTFDSKKPIEPGQSWTFVANKVGEWSYHDHLFSSFKAKLIIVSKKDWNVRNKVLKRDEIIKLIDKKGVGTVYKELQKVYDPSSAYAHSTFHLLGEVLYSKFGLDGIENCDNFAGFACYHGFFIRAVGDKGLEIAVDLDKKCVEKFGVAGLGCPHGIGHGLVEYFGLGKFDEALSICAKLTWEGPLFGCAGGVFMENNFPTVFDKDGIGEVTTKDAHGNLFEPCLSVAERFKQSCYFEQASWWNRILNSDYNRIDKFCSSLKVDKERESCFLGLGNTITESLSYNPQGVIAACSKMSDKESEMLCRAGAAWAFFSNPDKRSQSERICIGLESYEKRCLDRRMLVK